jgi:capsular exopolysaccharide synthesis family protein
VENNNKAILLVSEQEGFQLKEFLYTYLLRYWYLYILFVGSAYGLAWLQIRYTTPMYQVRSSLLIKDENNRGNGISTEALFQDLGLMQDGPKVLDETQILKSRTLMTDVVKMLGLDVEYYAIGRVRSSEMYPNPPIKAALYEVSEEGYNVPFMIYPVDEQFFRLNIRGKNQNCQYGEKLQLPQGNFIFTKVSDLPKDLEIKVLFKHPEDAAANYAGALGISQISTSSSVLDMSFKTATPEKGVAILNTLVVAYNKATVEDKNTVGKNTIQFIDDRLKFLSSELSDVEGNLEQYKKTNEIPTEIESNVGNLITAAADYEKILSQLEIQKSLFSALEDYLKNQLTQFEAAPINLLPQNSAIAVLVGRFNDLVLERRRLLRSAKEDNPVVQNLSGQINLLRSSILESIANLRQELDLQLTSAKTKNNFYQSRIRTIPTKERGLIEIKRQQGIKETLFLFLLQKREETALSLAVATSNARVIDAAIGAGGPISPNKRSIYLTAILIGLLIPSLIVYLRYLLTNTVQTEADISAATQTPILGGIANQTGKDPVVVKKNSRSNVAEMFRLLRTNLQFLGAGQNNQVILVTSSVSGEGKSFITLNLGITLALAEKKVVIIELDLRKPKLVRYLTKQPAEDGITSYMIGQLTLDQLINQSEIHPKLSYIASGPVPPNPAELLLTDQLAELILELRKRFDYIVMDTPPVGMVADALLLSKLSDCSLYVVRQGYSYKTSLALTEELYQEKRLPQLAIIFNGIKSSGLGYGYGYGYGKRYGYGYGYGYGARYGYGYGYYEDAKKPRPWWQFWKKRK